MTDEVDNAAPAGADGGAPAPTEYSVRAAAERMESWSDTDADTSGEPDPETDADDQPVETDAPDADTAAVDEQNEPEDTSIDWEKVPGTAKFRLRDGTEVTAADLKRDFDDLRSVKKTREELATKTAEFQQVQSRIAQEAQQFARVAPLAIAAIQATLPEVPPMPGKALFDEDMFAYQEQLAAHMSAKAEYEQKISQMREIDGLSRQQRQRAQQEEQQAFQSQLEEGHKKLLERIPALRDEKKRREFFDEFMSTGKDYGFAPDELSSVYDPRVIEMAADAMAYRKLKANPPKAVQPTQKTTPVAAPGRRVGVGEASTAKKQELIAKAQNGARDPRSIAAIIAQLDL